MRGLAIFIATLLLARRSGRTACVWAPRGCAGIDPKPGLAHHAGRRRRGSGPSSAPTRRRSSPPGPPASLAVRLSGGFPGAIITSGSSASAGL